jgi:hypothetical protein
MNGGIINSITESYYDARIQENKKKTTWYLLQIAQTFSGIQPASYSIGIGVLYRE